MQVAMANEACDGEKLGWGEYYVSKAAAGQRSTEVASRLAHQQPSYSEFLGQSYPASDHIVRLGFV